MRALCKIPQIKGEKNTQKKIDYLNFYHILLASNKELEDKGFTKDNVLYLKLF